MRIALVLLFLLALGALPGALLPQRSLNQSLVDQYFTDHPTLAPLLDRLGFFDVFAAPWFAAVYLLLMISLVGCVLPRALEHAHALRAAPVAVPRNLGRLPHHAVATLDAAPDEVTEAVRARLKGWRVAETADGISAEKGYLREAGNLVFHLALIGLLARLRGRQALRLRGAGHRPVRRRPVLQHRHPRLRHVPRGPARRRHPTRPVLRAGGRLHRHLPRQRPGVGLRGEHRLPDGRRPRGGHRRVATVPARGEPPAAPRRRARLPAGTRLHAAVHRDVPGRAAAHRRRPVEPGRPHHDAVAGRHEVPTARRHRRGAAQGHRAGGHRAAGAHHRPAATSSPRCSRRPTTRRSPSTCCAATSASTTGAASPSSPSTRPRWTPARW